MYTPGNPSFTNIKVGFKGVKFVLACFRDVNKLFIATYIEPCHSKTCLWAYADSEGPDQTAHAQSDPGLRCPLIDYNEA